MTEQSPISILAAQSEPSPLSFTEYGTRRDEMSNAVSEVVSYLAGSADSPDWRHKNVLKRFAATQGRLYRLSWRNALLVALQCPDATRVQSVEDWEQNGATAKQGEHRIWIWDPIYDTACPKCGNTPAYHKKSHITCRYHQTGSPEHWPTDVVGTRPAPYYDVSQVTGVTSSPSAAQSPLRGVGSGALKELCEELATDDGYELNTVDRYDLQETLGQLRQSPMTLQPIIDVAAVGLPSEALTAIRYHLLADAVAAGDDYGHSDADEARAAWATYAVSAHIGYGDSHFSPKAEFPIPKGEDQQSVKELFEGVSSTAESYIKRLQKQAERRRRQFQQ